MNIELAGIVQSILTTPVHQIKLGSKPVFQVIHIFQYSCVKVFARAKLKVIVLLKCGKGWAKFEDLKLRNSSRL